MKPLSNTQLEEMLGAACTIMSLIIMSLPPEQRDEIALRLQRIARSETSVAHAQVAGLVLMPLEAPQPTAATDA